MTSVGLWKKKNASVRQRRPIGLMLSLLLLAGPSGNCESAPKSSLLSVQGIVEALEDTDGLISFQFVRQDPRFGIDLAPSPERAGLLAALHAADQTNRSVIVHYDVEGGQFTADRSRVMYPVRALEYDGQTFSIGDTAARLRTPAPRPSSSDEPFIRGLGLFYGGKYAESLAELDTALGSETGSDWKGLAHKLRARALSERVYAENEGPTDAGDRELIRALEDFREWQRLNPDQPEPLYKIGETLRELGAYPEALEVYGAISRGWPEQAYWAAIRTGATERELHRYPQALAALDKLVSERGPQVGMAYHYHRGWTLTELGRYAEAVKEFSEGLENQPDFAWAFLKRGCAEALSGQVDAALADHQAGLKLLQRFEDDSRASQYDVRRATQVESELRLAAQRKQPIDAKALCGGYWREEEGRSRSVLLPAGLPWVKTIEQGPSLISRAQSLVHAVSPYVGWAIVVALISVIGGYLKSRRQPAESNEGLSVLMSPEPVSREEQSKASHGSTIVWLIYVAFIAAWVGFMIAVTRGSARETMAAAFGAMGVLLGALFYLDRRQGLSGESVRQYLARKGRQVLAMGLVSVPLVLWFVWSIGGGLSYLVLAPLAIPLLATMKGLGAVRCPRCGGYVGIRMAFHTALWGIGGHYLESYCPACHVLLDEPRLGPRRSYVDE